MANTGTAYHSTRLLNRLIILLTLLILIYASVFSWQSWRDEKVAKLLDLENLVDLEEKAIDSYFVKVEDDLRGLGQELIDINDHVPIGPEFYDAAFALVSRFTKLHSGLLNVALVREDGQILLTGKDKYSPTLPTLVNQPSWIAFREESRPDNHLNVGRATKSLLYRGWNIPFRYEARDMEGKTIFILTDILPVDFLQNFWKDAPFTRIADLGIMRDDGFLVSRYPVPSRQELHEIYGKARTGALIQFLRQERFPDHGYTEGFGSQSVPYSLFTFRRLEHFPLTLFIVMPKSEIRAEWWNKVKIPYFLSAILIAVGIVFYRLTYRQQRVWEGELKNSKAFLDGVIERSPISMAVYDDKGTLIRTNELFHDQFLAGVDEMVGRYNILHDNQIEEQGFMPQVREAFENGTSTRFIMNYDTSLIQNLKLAKTKRMILDVTLSVVRGSDGRVTHVILQHMDITQQRQVEKKISELNRDFVSFLENTSDFVFFKDTDSRFRFCSQSLADLTGHASWRDMIGKHALDVFPKEIGQNFHEEDISVISIGKPILNKVNPYSDASNQRGWVSSSKWPLRNAEGKIVGLFGISRVITEMVRLEDELKKINKTLEQQVVQEVQKNMEQERMLIHQSRMAAMGELLGNIAYQWKQPLNALNILFFNIRDLFKNNELDEAYIDQVVEDGSRLVLKMFTIITDFRNFFRQDKKIEAFSALEQIRKTITLMESDFEKSSISIHIDAPHDLILLGFPNEYSHVLINLFSNAIEAILKHHLSLSGSKGTVLISGSVIVAVADRDGQGCVMVRDSGGGVQEEILDRIFNPYFTTKEEGSGIGLYMSKMIIERRMNGTITAKNIDGGTEFSISVPLAKDFPLNLS